MPRKCWMRSLNSYKANFQRDRLRPYQHRIDKAAAIGYAIPQVIHHEIVHLHLSGLANPQWLRGDLYNNRQIRNGTYRQCF